MFIRFDLVILTLLDFVRLTLGTRIQIFFHSFFFLFIYFRPHPYIFFNPDHDTMTFLGFRVDQEGNLLDPQTRKIIQEGIMTRHLRTGLYVQKVDLENSFESYSKYVSSNEC